MAEHTNGVIPPEESLAIINRFRDVDPMEAMIPILQDIQTRYGHITEAVANQMADELGLSVTEIYGVITFYSFFRFTPRSGRVLLTCEGTSCYVRGAGHIRRAIEDRLNCGPGQSSADGKLAYEPSSVCIGACDLGPLAEVDGRYYTHLTPEKINAVIDELLAEEPSAGEHGAGRPDMGPYGYGPTALDLGSAIDTPNPVPEPLHSGLLPKGLT